MKILSFVKITPASDNRKKILDILHSIKGPANAIHGSLSCCIYEEEGDEAGIVFLEQWRTWEDFIRHIRSDLYGRVLEAMELSMSEPEVCFFEVTAMKGMELIEAIRNSKSGLGNHP